MRKSPDILHRPDTVEPGAGAGFSDWQKAIRALGQHTLAHLIEKMDPGDSPGGVNSHRRIATQVEQLQLPAQAYVFASVEDFLKNPQRYFAQIPYGDFFFVSIKPGTHLAHGNSEHEVVNFVQNFAAQHPQASELEREMYISHNGNTAMSGHIIIRGDDAPNTITGEFTIGNFNAFHRGHHSPEISLSRSTGPRFNWTFNNSLQPNPGEDWRDDTLYPCDDGSLLTRQEMAEKIYDAISRIPRDGDYYLPGYYEVLLAGTASGQTRPVFIEALPAVKL